MYVVVYSPGMTKKITISVPDDVAAYLEHVDNVSGYLANLARRDQRKAVGLQQLADAGYHPTPEGVDRMRQRFAEARSRINARRPQ